MHDASAPIAPQTIDRRRQAPIAAIAVIAAAATAVNLALLALGAATGAALRLDPAGGFDPNHELTAWDVGWKTAGMLLLGATVIVLVARRSRRWAVVLVWAAAALGAASAIGPYLGAHDAATAWLLLGMHAVGTLAAVAIALVVVRSGRQRDRSE